MGKVSIKGVLIGSITDIVGTSLFQIPLVIYITIALSRQGIAQEQMNSALLAAINSNPLYFVLSFLIGALGSVLGGYIAARIAKHDQILNGALASLLCVASGVYAIFFGHSQLPLWQHLISIPLSVGFAALGGYLCLRQMQSQTHSA